MMRRTTLALMSGLLMSAQTVSAEEEYFQKYYGKPAASYEVTVTNITKGQSFTPILATTHHKEFQLFELGQEASGELALLAEGGDINPLKATLDTATYDVSQTATTSGLLNPGQSTTFEIQTNHGFNRFSFAAMLIPTNDTFVSLNNIKLPKRGSKTFLAAAYDAGSETNDELCVNIPGPVCGGSGASAEESGEGFIHISPGIHGSADLARSAYDWRDAVATVSIKRVRKHSKSE